MPVRIEHNINRVVTRVVYGTVFAEVALQEAISDTLHKGVEVAQKNITTDVYMRAPSDSTHYERTYTLYHSVKGSRFFATGGQVFLSKQSYKRRYYPRYVDAGTEHMEGRRFWAPTVEALKAIVTANMIIAAEKTAQMLGEGF